MLFTKRTSDDVSRDDVYDILDENETLGISRWSSLYGDFYFHPINTILSIKQLEDIIENLRQLNRDVKRGM